MVECTFQRDGGDTAGGELVDSPRRNAVVQVVGKVRTHWIELGRATQSVER